MVDSTAGFEQERAEERPGRRPVVRPVSLHAAENLRFIRTTMESATTFTSVPGWGGVLMGAIGFAAALLSSRAPLRDRWLAVWLGAAVLAIVVGSASALLKMRREGSYPLSRVGRRALFGLLPPIVTGAALTPFLLDSAASDLVPAVWLLLYGAGVIGGGVFSVRPVGIMGALFMIFGGVALVAPESWAMPLLGLAFGGLHVVFGAWIARFHGG